MRLIDADALHRKVLGMTDADFIDFADMLKLIDSAPTIDPAKHGKWVKHVLKNANVPWGHDCSACGAWFVVGEDTIGKYCYCPNCGARMEKNGEKN